MARKILRAVLGFLLHPIAVRVLGVLLLFVVLWLARLLLGGPGGTLPWLDQELVTWAVLVAAVLVTAGYLWQRHRARKRSESIEEQIRRQSREQITATVPDRRGDIEELEKRFDEALGALRTSRLGRGALYALPWYVIIGPPGCGKTTLLTRSGLNFPTQMNQGARGVRGVGGTRNCDWWFTDRAILLDTAGRYTTETEDHEEWMAFLDLVRRARRECPLNGLMVSISIEDVLSADAEQLEHHAERIRARIDEVTERLEMVLPIYLVFTKCDLLEGFVEAFEGMTREQREQVWGHTLESGSRSRPVHETFASGFDELVHRLQDRRLVMLAEDRPWGRQRRVFAFPLQLGRAKDRLVEFVRLLTQPDPYREEAELRGYYFTSGTQEGTPVDRALADMRQAFKVRSEPGEVAPAETKAYFIHDLLTDVIIPDQDLARRSSAVVRRRTLLRYAGLVACGLVTLLLTVAMISATVEESARIDSAEGVVRDLETARIAELDPARDAGHVELLERLRSVFVDTSRAYWGGGPNLIGPDHDLYEGLWRAYRNALSHVFLQPMMARVAEELRRQLPELHRLPGQGGLERVREVEDLLYAYHVIGRDDVPLDRELLGQILERRFLWSWEPGKILTEGEPRDQHSDPEVLHREAFLDDLLRPFYRDMAVSYDEGLAGRVARAVENYDPDRAALREDYRKDPDVLYEPGARESAIREMAEEKLYKDAEVGSEGDLERRLEVLVEELTGWDREVRRKELLGQLANPPLPAGLGRNRRSLRRLLDGGGLEQALEPAYRRITDALIDQELIDLEALGGPGEPMEAFRASMEYVVELQKPLAEIAGRRLLSELEDDTGRVGAVVQAFRQAYQGIGTVLADRLGRNSPMLRACLQHWQRVIERMLDALANEVRTEAWAAWSGEGPGGELLQMKQRFPFRTEGSPDAVDTLRFRRLFAADGGIARFAALMRRAEKEIALGTMQPLRFTDGMETTLARTDRIRRLLLAEDGFRDIEFTLPEFETQQHVVTMVLDLGEGEQASTDDPSVMSRPYRWRIGRTGVRLVVELAGASLKRMVNDEKDRTDPWCLFRLVYSCNPRPEGANEVRVERVWTYEPGVNAEEREARATFVIRSTREANPFLPEFFRLPEVEGVFRAPEDT